jgi:F-type H+-transporting ATPase subunit delta
MASQKAIRRDARALFKLSLGADGALDAGRVTAILAAVEANPPAGHLPLLRAYQRLVAAEVSRGQARIEHAGPVSEAEASAIAAAFSRHYGRAITPVTVPNPDLIAGLRVRVGDDVHDYSVAGTLAAVASAS